MQMKMKSIKGWDTLEAALIRGRSCLISHIGDSRVYAIDGEGIRKLHGTIPTSMFFLTAVKLPKKRLQSIHNETGL